MNVVYWSACSPVLRWAKLVMTENMNISVVFFAETLPRSRRDQNPLLYLKEERHHLAIKCKSIIKKIPWGCSCAIYKVSSIDVRNRWIIRLHDMTPSVQNIVWLKLFCSMFLMEKKKVFVEVSLIILVAVLSFVGMRMQSTQVDLTDRFILDGGIGIFGFFFRSVLVPKKFDFLNWLFIVACGFSVF